MSKAEKTRSFIIEKTAPIFNMKGYAGTSLTDMTTATGLTKGSIYGNFINKDEVAIAAFDYNLGRVTAAIHAEMNKKETIRAKLLVYANMYYKLLRSSILGGCPILNTATEADDTHPVLKQKALSAFHSWKSKLVGLIELGIKNREFKPDIHAEQIALTIIALIEGGTMISKLTEQHDDWKLIERSMSEFIEGLS